MWFHLVTVIFVIAKLADVIAWSWWLVFAPSIAGILFAALLIFGIVGTAVYVESRK